MNFQTPSIEPIASNRAMQIFTVLLEPWWPESQLLGGCCNICLPIKPFFVLLQLTMLGSQAEFDSAQPDFGPWTMVFTLENQRSSLGPSRSSSTCQNTSSESPPPSLSQTTLIGR